MFVFSFLKNLCNVCFTIGVIVKYEVTFMKCTFQPQLQNKKNKFLIFLKLLIFSEKIMPPPKEMFLNEAWFDLLPQLFVQF